jgi:hypothetical protein
MVRSSKKTVHCRTIAAKRNAQPIHEVDQIDGIESGSDDEALLSGDDSAGASNIPDVSVEKLLIWKENASLGLEVHIPVTVDGQPGVGNRKSKNARFL